jgi:hypothetical protein
MDFSKVRLDEKCRSVKNVLYRIKKVGYLQNQFIPVVAQTKIGGVVYDVLKTSECELYLLSSTNPKFIEHNKHMFERIGVAQVTDAAHDLSNVSWTWLFEVIDLPEKIKECRKVYVSTKDLDLFDQNEQYEWGLRFGNYTMPLSSRLIRKTK